MPPEQPEETKSSKESETEMYTTKDQTIYDTDNIFFEGNKALQDDQTIKSMELRPRKLTQVPKLS